ncbi:M3 family metallopeptidase [Pseudomonas rubra]|uniref:M3 family metallopeptidase n=1 Tax=Pseudomonas rubra TaxID=2942627 RepID=A0ABT5PCA6_9PSED|nr:M3 family metallopeptidase [Pseudomonas rubra]MDD1015589.1 M3 family metallopeptidase [Pseudomonas rubra]MDD1038787.1 M3 family metallopeptidase [Pseudomonas rubra]MDD1153674.1 M3 family metallopeptidase [Pseudomonas rubra]
MPRPNPLLQPFDLFPYTQVRIEDLQPAIEQIVEDNHAALAQIVEREADSPTWSGLVLAIEALDQRLEDVFYALVPLAFTDDEWGAAVDECHGQYRAYRAQKYQNIALLSAYQRLDSTDFTAEQRAVLARILRDFRLEGANVAASERQQFMDQVTAIVGLEARFQDNLAVAAEQWSKHITQEHELAGVPATDLQVMQNKAQASGLSGWLLTLDESTCGVILRYGNNRELRETMYLAYLTRASDQVAGQSQLDNQPVLQALLRLRHEKDQLLGFSGFIELSLQTKAAQSSTEVEGFLNTQIALSMPRLEREASELRAFAKRQGCGELQPWDYEFYAQKMRLMDGVDPDQVLSEYFSFDSAVNGLIGLVEQLYDLSITRIDAPVWDPQVQVLRVTEAGEVLGHIYLDVYARPGKPGYPWAHAVRNRHVDADANLSLPIAVLFATYDSGKAQLGHLDLRKLFHEFHHCLQQVLMSNSHRRLNSIRDLGHDLSEFIAKLLEQWCWSAECLQSFSRHRVNASSASLGDVRQWLAARETQRGLEVAEELKRALLDFELHRGYPDQRSIQQVTEDVYVRTQVLPLAMNDRFSNGFDYMVTGYEAGYYCYLWAEVKATEVFARFKAKGVFNPRLGQAMREELLAPGALRSMSASVQAFLERSAVVE